MTDTPYHRQILQEEFHRRQERNAAFSLRAFARQLGISGGMLSNLLAGRRSLTPEMAQRLAPRLGLPDKARELFLLNSNSPRAPRHSRAALRMVRTCLAEDTFRVIADWYHYAILGLAQVEDNQASPAWIGHRLGLPEDTARAAFARLKRLGLVVQRRGRFRQSVPPLETQEDVPSAAVRAYHRQNLGLAADALDSVPVAQRYFSALTIAIDGEDLPLAKAMVSNFLDEFEQAFLNRKKERVFTLALQLFPVDHPSGPARPALTPDGAVTPAPHEKR